MQDIVVIGGGFAGFWSAAGAVRRLAESGISPDEVRVTLIEKNDYHNIRVRNYEANPAFVVPLEQLADPIGVRHLQGEVTGIDVAQQQVAVSTASGSLEVPYDRLVQAAGSHLVRPSIPGLVEYAFDVDTHHDAQKLEAHLAALPEHGSDSRYQALVIGAGLTGVESACELPDRLRQVREAAGDTAPIQVTLADTSERLASQMGDEAQPVIEQALNELGVAGLPGVQVSEIDAHGATLADGRRIEADTVIWCAGMHATRLNQDLGVPLDEFGRVEVDECLRVKGLNHVFATGDTAWFEISPGHHNVMSCQHGRPMGRFAGHNVAADLLGESLKPLQIDWYTTILDLGPWGAVYCEGWDRHVVATRDAAKKTKKIINRERIYPPQNGNREDILAAAVAEIDTPPAKYGQA